ncbi:MAG: hypothetical protein IPG61_08240 [bacterium]|nr:hypothetical protein [bacterium]
MMVTRPELPKALLGNPKFTVTAEHVQEWIHSYLLRNTDLAVLPPAGNLVRQQAETASTSDVATDVMLGNRERPDLFVNVRIARATLEEVKGPEGESHCFFTLEPELEIVDCRTGLVQFCRSYPYRKDYTFSDVPNPRYWTAGRAGRFASTTRDALHAAACSLATAFEPAQASGSIRALDGTTAEFALDHGAVGPGVVFEIRRAGDEVRGLDGRTLGRFQERIGGARVISVGAEGNFVKVTSANQPVKVGDVLFVASSARDPLLSGRVLQIGEVTVEDRTNQGMANLPVETAGQVLERALVSRRSWAVLPAESGLRRHQEHRATLERGNFAIDGWADQSADVVADALVNLRLVMLPEREGPKGELILSVQGSFEVVDANGAVLYTDVEPVSKAIQRSRDPMKLSLGAGMDARPGRYADLTKSLVDKLVSDYR